MFIATPRPFVSADATSTTVTLRSETRFSASPSPTRASRRRVDLSSHAALVLRRQLLARKPNELGLVFPSTQGEILNDDNFRHRVFRPAVRRTKLTGVRFYDLRHTYAALMVAAGAHPKYLQAQMGHSSIRVTLDLYAHLFPDANRGVLKNLDAITAPSTPHRAKATERPSKQKVPASGDSESGSDGTQPLVRHPVEIRDA
jgi:integrase